MKWLKAAAEEIVSCIERSIEDLDMESVETFIGLLLKARDKKIFIVGMGRSGFVGRAFRCHRAAGGFSVSLWPHLHFRA